MNKPKFWMVWPLIDEGGRTMEDWGETNESDCPSWLEADNIAKVDSAYQSRTMILNLLTNETHYNTLTLRELAYVHTHTWPLKEQMLKELGKK